MTSQHTPTNVTHSNTLSRRTLFRHAAAVGLAAPALAALASSGAPVALAADSVSTGLDKVLQDAVAGGFPGVALSVERAGKSIYSGAAGAASIEQKTPLKASDRARIYSIAKTFTSIVTLQLVDEGVLSLDDTATKWLDNPAVTRIPNADTATLRQLLLHTSGIYDFADDNDSSFWIDAFMGPDANPAQVWTREELLAYADGAKHAPYFAPGEGYAYSNTNYILIGLMVEEATGHTFGAELKTRILEPLALADTFLAEGAMMPEGTVDAYQAVEGTLISLNGVNANLSWAWTFGGMVSTTADLSRFSRAVFSGELLEPTSFKEMFTFVPSDKPGKTEGMGIYKIGTPIGKLVGMDGVGPGANSAMMRHTEGDLTIVVLDNMAPDEGATEFLVMDVVEVVLAAA